MLIQLHYSTLNAPIVASTVLKSCLNTGEVVDVEFTRPNLTVLPMIAEVYPMKQRVIFDAGKYGILTINFNSKEITSSFSCVELERVLLFGAKIFAMTTWRYQFEELSFVTQYILNRYETLETVTTALLDRAEMNKIRFVYKGRLYHIYYADLAYVIGLDSIGSYTMRSDETIARITHSGYRSTITANDHEQRELAILFLQTIVTYR